MEIYPKSKFLSNLTTRLHLFEDKIHMDMFGLMRAASENHVTNNNTFGLILMMCKNSRYQLGALNAQSFVERMNSRGNLIVDKNRASLSNALIAKLAVMKTNTKSLKNTRDKCAIAQKLKLPYS